HAGATRRLLAGGDGAAYLGDNAKKSHPLAKIKATGPALPTSRSINWAWARLNGYDAARWHLNGGTLLTWGGQTLNALLAAVFRRSAPDRNFSPSPTAVSGDVFAIDLSIESIRGLARGIETANDFPCPSLQSSSAQAVSSGSFQTHLWQRRSDVQSPGCCFIAGSIEW